MRSMSRTISNIRSPSTAKYSSLSKTPLLADTDETTSTNDRWEQLNLKIEMDQEDSDLAMYARNGEETVLLEEGHLFPTRTL
jgi:cytoskeletal protein RodZ